MVIRDWFHWLIGFIRGVIGFIRGECLWGTPNLFPPMELIPNETSPPLLSSPMQPIPNETSPPIYHAGKLINSATHSTTRFASKPSRSNCSALTGSSNPGYSTIQGENQAASGQAAYTIFPSRKAGSITIEGDAPYRLMSSGVTTTISTGTPTPTNFL